MAPSGQSVRTARKGFVRRASLVLGLLVSVSLAWAWKASQAPPAPAPPPNWSALDKALLAAIRDGDPARVRGLLDQGADVNARDEAGETALMQAALNADRQMVQLLLQRGADVNGCGPDGSTALLRAVHDSDKVGLLLRHGAWVEDLDMVVAALVPGSTETLKLLLAHGGRVQAVLGGLTVLMAAAFSGDLDAVTLLLERGADANAKSPRGYTALHGAAFAGNAAIMALLCARGADPNVPFTSPNSDPDVSTPVMIAAMHGHADCLQPLLARGADVNFQGGPFERTALINAVTQGNAEVVRLLLSRGAAVNAEDWEGDTALAWARCRGETAIVGLLRQAGATEPPPSPPARPRPRLHHKLDAGAARRAVAASLPLLQRSGERFTQRKDCITCHQHSLVAMTVGLARRHGLPVDEGIASRERAAGNKELGQRTAGLLRATGIDALLAPYSLVGLAAEAQPPSRVTDALVQYLVLRQKSDGRWLADVKRPPEDGSDFQFTALAVRGLQAYAPPGRHHEIARRIARARDWLGSAKATETVDEVFQLLGLGWSNAETDKIQKAVQGLLREQRPDGGWAQLPTLPSDAYATGTVLYALHEGGGLPVEHPAYRRGVEFLLRTQLADGSWFVPTRAFPVVEPFNSGFPHGRSQFISAAATCWASMALTFTVPPEEGMRDSEGMRDER